MWNPFKSAPDGLTRIDRLEIELAELTAECESRRRVINTAGRCRFYYIEEFNRLERAIGGLEKEIEILKKKEKNKLTESDHHEQ